MSAPEFPDEAFRVFLAREVRRAVRRSGCSLRQVSATSGLSATTLSRAVNGRRAFFVPELFAIAAATGTSLDVADWVERALDKARHGVETGR